MATPGANLNYHNRSFAMSLFLRKLGLKPRNVEHFCAPTEKGDDPTSFPRQIGICTKYSTTTAPTTNTAADAPTGIGDICVYIAADNVKSGPVLVSAIDIYRCTAYTNTSTFTWTKIVD